MSRITCEEHPPLPPPVEEPAQMSQQPGEHVPQLELPSLPSVILFDPENPSVEE